MNKKSMKYVVGVATAVLLCGAGFFAYNNFTAHTANAQDNGNAATKAAADIAKSVDSAWAVRCNAPQGSEAGSKEAVPTKVDSKHCEIFQRQDMKETGQRVIEMAIGYPPEQKDARGVFVLPTGILLQEGVKLRIDENKPLEFQVRYCVPNGCMAYVTMNTQILEAMGKGESAFVEVAQPDGQKIVIPMPLKGFKKSLDEIKS